MDQPASPGRAAAWMAGWLLLMVVIAVAGREATRELSVFQVMEMRSILGLLMIYPLIHMAGGLAAMKTRHLKWHAVRNTVHYGAQFAWLAALSLIPLAQVVAIEFTMPIWMVLLAAFFLGERIHVFKIVAVVLGVIGVALIVRPGGELNHGQLIALLSAMGFAISVVMVKSLTRHDSAVLIMFWMLVIQSVIGLVPAVLVWQWPSASTWGWVVLVAFCGTFSHYCMARAMQHADATVVVPIDFLRVPLTALAGWAVYSERVDLLTVVGTALILCGNLVNVLRSR